MQDRNVYIMSGARTVIGDFGRALKDFLGYQLAVIPMEEALMAATKKALQRANLTLQDME